MAAFLAKASGVILKELHFVPAFGALDLKDGSWFPVTAVLSRAFHDVFSRIRFTGCFVTSPSPKTLYASFGRHS
jgi:hypothetical protein